MPSDGFIHKDYMSKVYVSPDYVIGEVTHSSEKRSSEITNSL